MKHSDYVLNKVFRSIEDELYRTGLISLNDQYEKSNTNLHKEVYLATLRDIMDFFVEKSCAARTGLDSWIVLGDIKQFVVNIKTQEEEVCEVIRVKLKENKNKPVEYIQILCDENGVSVKTFYEYIRSRTI